MSVWLQCMDPMKAISHPPCKLYANNVTTSWFSPNSICASVYTPDVMSPLKKSIKPIITLSRFACPNAITRQVLTSPKCTSGSADPLESRLLIITEVAHGHPRIHMAISAITALVVYYAWVRVWCRRQFNSLRLPDAQMGCWYRSSWVQLMAWKKWIQNLLFKCFYLGLDV